MGKHFIRYDEIEDVLTSIDLIAIIAPLAKASPSYWKWLIIGAQSALQGAMVCLLTGTNSIGVLDKKSAKQVLQWHEDRSGSYPEERLASFNDLLNRCITRPIGKPLALSASELEDVERLHAILRNNFAHFQPKSWSIERAGLPRILNVALSVVEEIMLGEELNHKLSGNRKRRLRKGIATARRAMA